MDKIKHWNFDSEFLEMLEDFNLDKICSMESFFEKTQNLLSQNVDIEYDIISLNIDRFKVINDIYGTEEGDKLLAYICFVLNDLTDSVNEGFARLYADNFAICKRREEAYEEKFAKDLKIYLSKYPLDVNISMCFGIYEIENRDISISSMFDRADMALKKIKGNYNRSYAYYEENHRSTLIEEQEIINDMHNALKNEEFLVYFQPKYILSDNTLSGAEALVRWLHPKKGMIQPSKFIPILEKTGFITDMDEYVWEFTCKCIRKWMDEGLSVVPISVNVSRIDIYNPNLCDNLLALIDKYNIPIKFLELEITETSYMENPAQLIETVVKLKKLGFIVEMDDFGTGYSSLNMLNQVPVDVLKLDLRFMKSVSTEGRSANILNSIVSMAKWLDLPVVAEGVETKEQVEFLKSIGCNKGQGYYFAMPMPHKEFEKLLSINNNIEIEAYKMPDVFVDLHEFWNPNSQVNILFNNFVGGLGIFELKGNNFDILRVNDRFYDIFELDRDTLYKMVPRFREYICKEDRLNFYKKLEEAKQVNGETTLEFRFKNILTNTIVYAYLRMRVILNSPERTLFLGSIDNVTDEKLAQDALRQNEERYQYVMELTKDIIFEYDVEKSATINSQNFEREFGFVPLSNSWVDSIINAGAVQDKDIEEFANTFGKMMTGEEHLIKCKFELKNINNEYRWYSIYTRGVYDKKNKLKKIIGVISDVEVMINRLME